MRIDGTTRFFATPGDPVAQVRLPQVMETVFRALAVNAVWLPMHVGPDGLVAVLQGLRTIRNFGGLTVAIPYKPAIGALLDRIFPRAEAAGAVNIVRREPDGSLSGDMVDGTGFVRGLALAGRTVAGARAWLVGTGGGGSAIAAALAEAGVESLHLQDALPGRAEAVAERVRRHFPRVAAAVGAPPGAVDYAINATPAGLAPGDPLPFDPAGLAPATVVCDIIMKPKETALLRAAAARGLAVHHGHHMLDSQIPMYLEYLGLPCPDERLVIALAGGA